MKLKKQNVIYRVEDPEEIQALKARGFKEVKPKSKLDLPPKEGNNKPNDNKEGKDKE